MSIRRAADGPGAAHALRADFDLQEPDGSAAKDFLPFAEHQHRPQAGGAVKLYFLMLVPDLPQVRPVQDAIVG